ncbi:MBL fold metallo-hydrolase [Aneurinibacillus sp. REN35]|uniref:MBL fold metallo-hydrolase n=1 Tax=Aneurinibacillus sp. REN35 TaxID=3237286 RepID=UPI00352860A9
MDDFPYIPVTSITSGEGKEVGRDVYFLSIQIVNVCFVGNRDNPGEWVLVDAGMPKSADTIMKVAEKRFGAGSRPKAIVLTHGHFDHVGALRELVEHWQVPVYAHELEMPYVTGKSDYPPADPSADHGLMVKMSPLLPRHGIDISPHVKPLPLDGSIPAMPEWRWIHTPGHTHGHISLFRGADRTLIVGDAFTTVKQESLYKVLTQEQELNGPPAYFTTNWQDAWDSVKRLAALKPSLAVPGHGIPMSGERLIRGLEELAANFARTEIPKDGKYVDKPE